MHDNDSTDGEPTMPCPACRADIHEESERCPRCGHYITDEDAPAGRKPWWVVLGAIACLWVVYRWIVG